jgi:hypothetical protein
MALTRTDQHLPLVSLGDLNGTNVLEHIEWYGQGGVARYDYLKLAKPRRTFNGNSTIDPAHKAFLAAKKLLYEDLTQEERKQILMNDKCSMKDVEAAVIATQEKYEQRNKKPKLQQWLGRCASRIVHYANIMDVLVQHHPEYVSLAWGAMKFLFVVGPHCGKP